MRHTERGDRKGGNVSGLPYIRKQEKWHELVFNPPIALGSASTKVTIFCLFVPQEPAVLQIYGYFGLGAPQLSWFFQATCLCTESNATQTSSADTQGNPRVSHFKATNGERNIAHVHGPRHHQQAPEYLQTQVKAPSTTSFHSDTGQQTHGTFLALPLALAHPQTRSHPRYLAWTLSSPTRTRGAYNQGCSTGICSCIKAAPQLVREGPTRTRITAPSSPQSYSPHPIGAGRGCCLL